MFLTKKIPKTINITVHPNRTTIIEPTNSPVEGSLSVLDILPLLLGKFGSILSIGLGSSLDCTNEIPTSVEAFFSA